MDYIDTYLQGDKPAGVTDTAINGTGILKHLFWQKQEKATELLSKKSGVDKNTANDVLIQLAPIALELLGKAKKQTAAREWGSGISDIVTSLIGSAVSKQKTAAQGESNPIMDIAEKFLDQDNDGSIWDDLIGMAMKKFWGSKA